MYVTIGQSWPQPLQPSLIYYWTTLLLLALQHPGFKLCLGVELWRTLLFALQHPGFKLCLGVELYWRTLLFALQHPGFKLCLGVELYWRTLLFALQHPGFKLCLGVELYWRTLLFALCNIQDFKLCLDVVLNPPPYNQYPGCCTV